MPEHVDTQTGTTMGAAFAAAGYEPPYDRLKRLMREAIEEAGTGLFERVADRFIAKLFEEDDPHVMWELFAEQRMPRVRALHTEVLVACKREQEAVRPPDKPPAAHHWERHEEPEPVVRVNRAGDAQITPESQQDAPPSRPSPPPPRQRRTAEAQDIIADIAQTNHLRSILINGRPVEAVTAGESDQWCTCQESRMEVQKRQMRDQERKVRFVRLLIEGLTPEQVIGKSRTEQEAAKAYERALQEIPD